MDRIKEFAKNGCQEVFTDLIETYSSPIFGHKIQVNIIGEPKLTVGKVKKVVAVVDSKYVASKYVGGLKALKMSERNVEKHSKCEMKVTLYNR